MPKTDVLFFFDTEDFVYPKSSDSILKLCNLFTEEGVRGHFAIVGYLARQLVQQRRFDVLDALKPHLVGTHTLYHSVHPDICELSDTLRFEDGYNAVLKQEAEALGMIKAATGVDNILFAVPPGDCKSYAAMYAYADMGIPFYCDTTIHDREGHDLWYANQRHISYYFSWESMIPGEESGSFEKSMDEMAKREMAIVYCHPHMVNSKVHWDAVNYKHGNMVPFGKWNAAPQRSEEDIEEYLRRIREGLRAIKNDQRFHLTDLEELSRNQKERATITKRDLPAIREALRRDFSALHAPSLCVADVFQAVTHFLLGEENFTPGYVRGFLEKPVGVNETISVSADNLRKAAKGIDLNVFLPASIKVGNAVIGPADYLFAALDVLCDGADKVIVSPKEQLGSLENFPALRDMRLVGTWVHTPDLKDNYLSDRLRWQLWTLRYERA